jgi:enoyl-CoA hydratase/carnithine racemase
MTQPDGGPPGLEIADDGVATITLRRPQHRNRLHREDLHRLRAHFEALRHAPGAKALVITGEGEVFSAGFHIGELDASDDTSQDPYLFEETVDALESLPLPTVARLNGSVYGGGTDLALACDFRIGVAGMSLRMAAAGLGLHYYPSGLQRYVERLGLGAAKRLFLLAELVPATELQRIGYLDDLVTAEHLDARVRQVVDALAANAPLAVRGMKLSLNEVARGTAELATLRAREAACATSADLREGLAAFAARRPPRFHGR